MKILGKYIGLAVSLVAIITFTFALAKEISYALQLGDRVTRLEGQVQTLEAARNAPTAIDIKQQKCTELADVVATGQRHDDWAFVGGPEIAENARRSMESLGCNSAPR